jgi:hypothetical protein
MTRTAFAVCATLSVATLGYAPIGSAPLAFAQNQPSDPLPLPTIPPESPVSSNPFHNPGGGSKAAAEPGQPIPPGNGIDLMRQATAIFNQAKATEPGKYLNARDLFGLAFREKVKMTPEQTAAWAYCRIKVAADKLNKSTDANTAADVVAEVEGALSTVPDRLALHEAAREILLVAQKRAGNTKPTRLPAAIQVNESGWNTIETSSFRVKYSKNKSVAEEVAKVAETARTDLFKKWSGPPGGDWTPKCEIVIHTTITEFTEATQLTATGRAEVKLTNGAPTARRIDLRADDETLTTVALPRELTHVILADLYPNQAPPKWAEVGMAVLSTSEVEVSRYLQTARKFARDGDLLPVEKILSATEVPAKSVTGFHVESVALVDYLVRWKGEKAFTAFVRDTLRYGNETALKRQYGFSNTRALEDGWKRGTTPTVRGQGE